MEALQDLKVSEVDETINATESTTILDMLNPDCWRLVFDYLTINDIIRLECVSRAWQQNVLEYIQGVHNYRIEYLYQLYSNLPNNYNDYRSIKLRGHVMLFEEMIKKMGPYMVKMVANCIDEDRLKAIAENCPKLEDITLREDYLNELITSKTLEHIAINKSSYVTGRFLANLKTNLKTLALNSCELLMVESLQSAVKYLTELTRLELNDNCIAILQNLQLLVVKMPNLEHLSLMKYNDVVKLPSVSHLSRLRELHLWENESVTDEWLLTAAQDCPNLRTVNVGWCSEVTARGVLAMCRARPTLTELVVSALEMQDSDLEAYARCCGSLRLLDASGCAELTQNLPSRLSWPRALPLKLRLHSTPVEVSQVYDGLIILVDETPPPYRPSYCFDTDSEPDFDHDYDDYDNNDDYYDYDCFDSEDDRDWDDIVEEYLETRDPNDA